MRVMCVNCHVLPPIFDFRYEVEEPPCECILSLIVIFVPFKHHCDFFSHVNTHTISQI